MKALYKSAALLLVALMVLAVCLCGCQSTSVSADVSPVYKSALELCTTAYKDSQLEDIYKTAAEEPTMKALDAAYPIECLRQDAGGWHVIYAGVKRILVLYFDSEGSLIELSKVASIFRLTNSRGAFDALNTGDNVTEVQKADPTCFFPFLVTGTGEPLRTDHYTEDGYHTVITYDESFNIKTIDYEVM